MIFQMGSWMRTLRLNLEIQVLYVGEHWTFQNNALGGHICVTLFLPHYFNPNLNAHPKNTLLQVVNKSKYKPKKNQT